MVLNGVGCVWECVGKSLAWCLMGFGQVVVWVCDGVWLAFDCFFGSRSLEGEKVEEPEPLRSGERTTVRVLMVLRGFVGK